MNKKVAVIGSGSWASALSNVLADNGYLPIMYTRHPLLEDEINNKHTNSKYFKDVKLNENVKASTSLEEVFKETNYILISIPSKEISTIDEYKKYIKEDSLIINSTKGFDVETGEGISLKIEKILEDKKIRGVVCLLGPTFATEVVEKQYTCITATSCNKTNNEEVQHMFSNDYFRVYTNDDLIGCEISAGMKNIIAIASGIACGLKLKNNTRAALITRGLSEIVRYGLAYNAKLKTFFSLACIGDLYMTCSSDESRNFKAGYKIGCDDDVSSFLKENKSTVEGIEACKIIYNSAKKMSISMPITESIYKIVYENEKPSLVLQKLMTRDLKEE